MTTLRLEEASERTLATLRPTGVEEVTVGDAMGRVLIRDVASPVALPPWDNSAMDGYAVQASDVRAATPAAPVSLRVIEAVPAGGFPFRTLGSGEATRIMTGAPIPEGADCVVRIEDTDGGESVVRVRDGRDAGQNVRTRGEDVSAGDVVLRAGTVLGPAALAMLAATGHARVEAGRAPRVAIFGSGDELVPIERFSEVRDGRRIVASNGYALAAIVRAAGGVPLDLGIAPDDRDAIRMLFETAASRADLIVTTAGVSVGAHDHSRAIVDELGAVDFWRIAARPGSQLAFGNVRGVPWLGLPGNPVSAIITGELFVRPAVLRMQGARAVHRAPIAASLGVRVTRAGGSTQLLRARLTLEQGRWSATLTGAQSSGRLASIADADALLVIPPGAGELAAGATVAALPLLAGGPMLERLTTTLGADQ